MHKHNTTVSRWAVLSGALLSGLAPVAGDAAEWSLQPHLAVTGEYDDNIRLTSGPHDEVWGVTLSPGLSLNYLTEVLEARARAALDIGRYDDDSFDRDEQLYEFLARYRSSELTTWSLRTAYQLESVLRRISVDEAADIIVPPEEGLPVADPLDPEASTDVGLVEREVERSTTTFAPAWTRRLTERSTVGLRYRYRDVSYDDAAGTGLNDSQRHSGAASLEYLLTERDQLIGEVSYESTRFEMDPEERTFEQWELTAGIRHLFSETLTGRFDAGFRSTSAEQGDLDEDDTGYVARARLDKRGERTILSGRAEHQVVPRSTGVLVQTDRLALFVDHKLSQRLRATLLGEVFQEEGLEDESGVRDRFQYEISPALRWLWTPELSLALAYRRLYQEIDDDNGDEDATSNAVFLTVDYRWPKIVLPW